MVNKYARHVLVLLVIICGITADISDNPLPSLTVLGCSLTAVEVEASPVSVMLSSHLFFCLKSSFPSTVPGKIFFYKGTCVLLVLKVTSQG